MPLVRSSAIANSVLLLSSFDSFSKLLLIFEKRWVLMMRTSRGLFYSVKRRMTVTAAVEATILGAALPLRAPMPTSGPTTMPSRGGGGTTSRTPLPRSGTAFLPWWERRLVTGLTIIIITNVIFGYNKFNISLCTFLLQNNKRHFKFFSWQDIILIHCVPKFFPINFHDRMSF